MKGLQFALASLAFRVSYAATLFGVDYSYSANSTTMFPETFWLDISESESLAAETYEVMSLSMAEIPPAYLSHMQLDKRDWISDVGFAVAGGVVAATGLARKGAEASILKERMWEYKKEFREDFPEVWKRAQTVKGFQIALAYVHEFIKGAGLGLCLGKGGNWASNNIANSIISGASSDKKEEKRDGDFHRKGFVERWTQDSRKHDELKRAPDDCNPEQSTLIDLHGMDAFPSGSTWKVTCKAYRDFGWCDQLDVAKQWITQMVSRGMVEGAFTVYNRQSAIAHMRCSVEVRGYFFNHYECPFEILGDQDGEFCIGCPYRT